MCSDVDKKPLGDYILRHNNFGLIYEISKDIATARSKNGNFQRNHSHLMPFIQRIPTNIGINPYIFTNYSRYISTAGSLSSSKF